jgi:hypothetical protein
LNLLKKRCGAERRRRGGLGNARRVADSPRAAARGLTMHEWEAKEIARYEARSHFAPAAVKMTLAELLGAEDGSLEEWGIIQDTVRRFVIYCGQDGAHPASAMRVFYAVAAQMGVEPFCLLTTRQRGALLGESHGAAHWRTKKLAEDPCRRNGAHSFRAPGAKNFHASAVAAEAAKGNRNRSLGSRDVRKAGPGDSTPLE